MNRKAFIESLFRYTLLSGIFALIVFLFRHNKIDAGGSCSTGEMCTRCGKLTACTLPEAIKYRTDERER